MKPLIDYWPRYLQELLEFNLIAQAEQPEFDVAAEKAIRAADELFLETLSLDGVKRWEKIIGIVPKPDETLAFRRKRILNIYGAQLPFTKRWLATKLDTIIGPGLWELIIDDQTFKFYVQSAELNQNFANELQETIEMVKPANMEFFYIVWILYKLQVSPNFRSYLYSFLESGTEVCGTQYSESTIGRLIRQVVEVSGTANVYMTEYPQCGPEVCGIINTEPAVGRVIIQPIQASNATSAYTATFPECGPEIAGTLPV